jgi:hypothetical protein
MRKELYNETAPKPEEQIPENDFDDEGEDDFPDFERKPMWREGQDGFRPRPVRNETQGQGFTREHYRQWINGEDDEDFEYDQPEWDGPSWDASSANATELFHHHGGHHGPPGPGHRQRDDSDDSEYEGREGHHQKSSKRHSWKQRRNPYKDWLDRLPFMDKEVARAQAKSFWNGITFVAMIFGAISFAIWQGIQFYMINQAIKAQKILENKYMGPEIVAVRPNARQVAVASAPSEPVIQYIEQPPVQTSATGNIVSAN